MSPFEKMAGEDGDVPIYLKLICLICVHSMIKITGQRLGIDGGLISDDVSKPEVLSVIIRATAALAKLQLISWINVKLTRSLSDPFFRMAFKRGPSEESLERRTHTFETLPKVTECLPGDNTNFRTCTID